MKEEKSTFTVRSYTKSEPKRLKFIVICGDFLSPNYKVLISKSA